MEKDYISTNQKLWNDKTKVHLNSTFYDVDGFKQGKTSLKPIEIELSGNVEGKNILHLQCHFGLDSMSLSRLGANVTGVDLSNIAIDEAKNLRTELGLNTQFIQSDVYELKEKLHTKFDMVFTSYGVLGWLPDMKKWADVVSHFLKPKGKLILVEFHPVLWMFNPDFTSIEFNYSCNKPIIENTKGSYTNPDALIENRSMSWNHGLSSVFQALLTHNLEIEDFQEYNFSPYDCFQNTVKTAEDQ